MAPTTRILRGARGVADAHGGHGPALGRAPDLLAARLRGGGQREQQRGEEDEQEAWHAASVCSVGGVTQEIAALAAEHGRLAVDTEFMSERRYRALLCLVQVAVPDPDGEDGVRTDVLDPLEGGYDPSPLAGALADPAIEVVMHAGRQDVQLLRRDWNTEVRGLFDTQVAAGFLGLGPQEGYESLVRRVLDIRLKGGEGFTRWDRRPADRLPALLRRADASRLLALGEALQERLEERGRLEWALEECRPLENSSDERDPQRLFERLPKLGRLSAQGRGVARELIDWRERTAEQADRAATSILPDQALMEVARRMPRDRNALEEIRGLPQPTLHRRHRELIEAIQRGKDREVAAPSGGAPPRDSRDAPVVALAQAVVRHRVPGGRGGHRAGRHPGGDHRADRGAAQRRPAARPGGLGLAPRAGRPRARGAAGRAPLGVGGRRRAAGARRGLNRRRAGYGEAMPTEPSIPTLSDVVRRAADVTDPGNELVEALQERTEDADEPVTAIEDIDERVAEEVGRLDPEGDDPVLAMTAAVAVYLGHRRDELAAPREELLRLAARAEFDGSPPEDVADWLAAEGVSA